MHNDKVQAYYANKCEKKLVKVMTKSANGNLNILSILFRGLFKILLNIKKQPSRGVLKKRCSENIQQIYRRTPMSKCDFNKVAKQLY